MLAVGAATALALLGVAAATLPQPRPAASRVAGVDVATETAAQRPIAITGDRRAPGTCGGVCEFSSAGSAELHAFDHGAAGVTHVLYLEARWTKPNLRELRARTEAWQQAMTVQHREPHAAGVVMDHWSSDLPAARVVTHEGTGAVTIAVTVDRLEKVRPGRLYRTQVLLRSPQDLDGATWHSTERIGRLVAAGGGRRFQAEQSSTPRRGISGWCPQCYVTWDLDGTTHR